MDDILFLTGGNTTDERTRQITYDEAQKMLSDAQNEKETYQPVCSMIIQKESVMHRKVIYFTFQIISIDLVTSKQVWYEKVNGNEFFVDKIVYNNYKKQNMYMELHFHSRSFSMPNICMIKIKDEKNWNYYVGDIEDTYFYRKIEFGDTNIIFKDLDTSFEPYIYNIQKCDRRFKRKKRFFRKKLCVVYEYFFGNKEREDSIVPPD